MGKLTSIVLQYLQATKEDFPSSFSYLAEDIEWVSPLPENVPFGGVYKGHAGVAEFFTSMLETFELGSYDIEKFDFIETDNTVVIVGTEEQALVKTTGKVFDMPFVWIVKFNDEGKICYLHEHNDTAAISAAYTK